MSLESTLTSWTGPSSPTEQDKQERTERMVREAVEGHAGFADCSLEVYAKGSYPNHTNVRADSDVDVAVECSEAVYWKEEVPGAHPDGPAYSGPWTPGKLRTALETALRRKFPEQVDTSGGTAIRVRASTARVDADVVPCFTYRYYFKCSRPKPFLTGEQLLRRVGDGLSVLARAFCEAWIRMAAKETRGGISVHLV